MNLGVSGSAFRVEPFLSPGPPQLPPWEPVQLQPTQSSTIAPGNPLVVSPFPWTNVGVGAAYHCPPDPEASQVIIQLSPEVGLVESAQEQTVSLAQSPSMQSAPEAPSGGAGYPALLHMASFVPKTIMPAAAAHDTQAGAGGHPHPPHSVPLVAQLVPIKRPASNGQQPQRVCGESVLDPAQSQAPHQDSCRPSSVYDNFRRWKFLKALIQRYVHRARDIEALSCFFM